MKGLKENKVVLEEGLSVKSFSTMVSEVKATVFQEIKDTSANINLENVHSLTIALFRQHMAALCEIKGIKNPTITDDLISCFEQSLCK